MPGDLDSVVSLYKTKAELVAAEERLHGIPEWMGELHEEHSRRQGEIDEVAAVRDTAAQERREAEGSLAEAQEKSQRYQKQLRQISSEREYTALLKEIDTAKAAISEYEQKVLEAIEKADQAEKDLQELREAFRDLDERYQKELAKWEGEKPEVARRVDELARQVETIRGELPRPTVALFDRIYERYSGHAVAQVVKRGDGGANARWHCEACSYNVRPQVVVEIRTDGTVNQCDSCKRFLYLDEEE